MTGRLHLQRIRQQVLLAEPVLGRGSTFEELTDSAK